MDGFRLKPGRVYIDKSNCDDPCTCKDYFQVISNKNGLVHYFWISDRAEGKAYILDRIEQFYELTEEEAEIVKLEHL